METIFTTPISELRNTIIKEIKFHLVSRNIEQLSLNGNVYAGENFFNRLTQHKALLVISNDFLDECEYETFSVEELDSILLLLTKFQYIVESVTTESENNLIDDDILSSQYYSEILEVGNKHNCIIDRITERDFVVMVSLISSNLENFNLMKHNFKNVSFGNIRNSKFELMKGGKNFKMQYYFIIKKIVSVKPLIDGVKGTQILKLLNTYNITTDKQFDLKLADLICNMGKYCHTINGVDKRKMQSFKKAGVKFLFNRKAFDKIDECESTLGDKLNGFYIGDISFHLRHHDFYQFYHGCYENQVKVVSEKYDGTKRDLSNINMEFMDYLPMFKDINDVFLNTFLKINL